jgi:hypothetical protein
MPLLDEKTFLALVGTGLSRELKEAVEAPPDFWSYFDHIPKKDFGGFDCSDGQIRWAFRTSDGIHDLVHVDTKEDKDAFMVLVVHLQTKTVVGHRLLDLK